MSLLLEDFSVTWIPEKFKGRFLEFIQPARRNEAVLRNDSLSLRDLLVQWKTSRSRVCRGREREIWALPVKSRYREIVSEDGLRFCGYQNPLVSTLNGSYFLPRTLHRFLETISAIAFSFSNFCNGYISEELKKCDVKDWSIYNLYNYIVL